MHRFFARLLQIYRNFESNTQITVLAVTPFSSEQVAVRLFGIQERWRVLYASSLERAVELRQRETISVILYDRDLPGVDWTKAVRTLLTCSEPACLILLSGFVDNRLWRTVLECGGYDVARKPLERDTLVPLVNGPCLLAGGIDLVTAS